MSICDLSLAKVVGRNEHILLQLNKVADVTASHLASRLCRFLNRLPELLRTSGSGSQWWHKRLMCLKRCDVHLFGGPFCILMLCSLKPLLPWPNFGRWVKRKTVDSRCVKHVCSCVKGCPALCKFKTFKKFRLQSDPHGNLCNGVFSCRSRTVEPPYNEAAFNTGITSLPLIFILCLNSSHINIGDLLHYIR